MLIPIGPSVIIKIVATMLIVRQPQPLATWVRVLVGPLVAGGREDARVVLKIITAAVKTERGWLFLVFC